MGLFGEEHSGLGYVSASVYGAYGSFCCEMLCLLYEQVSADTASI